MLVSDEFTKSAEKAQGLSSRARTDRRDPSGPRDGPHPFGQAWSLSVSELNLDPPIGLLGVGCPLALGGLGEAEFC